MKNVYLPSCPDPLPAAPFHFALTAEQKYVIGHEGGAYLVHIAAVMDTCPISKTKILNIMLRVSFSPGRDGVPLCGPLWKTVAVVFRLKTFRH